jgi:predicted flap endonuclease-1-like 5' DNA nuclease
MRDDLTKIKGIGPRVSGVLQSSGIQTFEQLASAKQNRLVKILTEAGLINLADPTNWPEQAKLIADADWEGLTAFQESI